MKFLLIFHFLFLNATFANAVDAQQLERLGVKKISYCAGTYTAAGVFIKGIDKTLMQQKQNMAIAHVGAVSRRNSLNYDETIEIAKKWYKERTEYYENVARQKYIKSDGSLDKAFINLLVHDDSDCNEFLNSLVNR